MEIHHLDKVIGLDIDCSIGVWSLLEVSSKYPFQKSELELIDHIQKAMKLNNLDPMALYVYGLYVNSCAGKMKGIDIKAITEKYTRLVIHSRDEIDIDSETIMQLLNKEPGKYIKDIYDDVEREILYHRLNNQKRDICNYILANYKG